MSKSDPATPIPPDPKVIGDSQTKTNIDTAEATARLNHSNQKTPLGSSTWTQNPTTGQWEQNVTLDPAQQGVLDSSNQSSQIAADAGIGQANRIAASTGQPLDLSGLNKLKSGADVNDLGQAKLGIDTQGTENLTRHVDDSGIQRQLKVPQEQLYAEMQNAQKAAYGMQAQYLDKDYAQRQHDVENKLTQQGVLQGSDAWNRETQNLGAQRTFDYNNAFNNSFDKGLAANNQLFNQDLSSGQFVNSAQAQQFGEGMQNAALNNGAAGQLYNQRMGSANLNNSALQTVFGDRMANAQMNNQTHAQQLQDLLTSKNQPLAESGQMINNYNALKNGSQVNYPQFGGTPQGNVAGTDLTSGYNNQFNAQMGQYNGQIAQNNATTTGLYGLGASALASTASQWAPYLASLSDRRAKENIEKMATRPDGLGIYQFEYKPAFKDVSGHGVHIGFMADEVEQLYPHAVIMGPDGFKMVNYAAL